MEPSSSRSLSLVVVFLLLLSTVGVVNAKSNILWSWPLPSGFSVDTGTLLPDAPFVMANGVIAIGSAPCPQTPRLCSNYIDYPSTQAFWALDAGNGKVKWTIPLPNGSVIQPVAAQNNLFFAEYNGRTIALDSQTGRITWSIPMSNWLGDPLIAGNQIVVPGATQPGNWTNDDPTLTAYDSSTGNLKWSVHTAPIDNSWQIDVSSQAGYGGGTIFAAGEHVGTYQVNVLSAYDASSGLKKWTRQGFSYGSCPRYMNGIVFAKQSLVSLATPIAPVNLVALNATAGQTLWNKTIDYSWPGAGLPCPMLGKDRLFVLSNRKAYQVAPDLVALNPSDGRELWRHSFPCEQDPLNSSACRPVLWNHQAVGDSVLFASAGNLYGIETTSGNVTWSYGFTVDNWNPLAYIDGVLYALNTPNGRSPSIVAFGVTQTVVSEMPFNVAITILTVSVLGIEVITKRTNSRKLNR
jgi:outer membrane protein assembly factor BamB